MPTDATRFLETAPLVPLIVCADTGDVKYVGPQAVELLGYPESEWMAAGFWQSKLFPDDQTTVRASRARLAVDGGRHNIEYRLEHADGRILWVSEVLGVGPAACGSVQLQGYLQDVTDRKRQEVALWKSEERLRSLLRHAPDALVLTNDDGVIVNMNDQAEALFNYRLFEVAGSSLDLLIPERLRSRMADHRASFRLDPLRRTIVDGHSMVIERADGSEIPVEIGMSLIDNDRTGRHILCSVRDLTARRRVEAQLRSSERRLRDMASVVPAMVCFIDPHDRYRFVTDAYADWYGRDREQLEGRRVREVVGEEFHEQLRECIEAASEGTATHFRGQAASASGRVRPVDLSIIPQHGDGGGVTGYFVVMLDVSNEIAAREADQRHRSELAHVGRVATLGELAASIAHELNQPLTAIVANAQAGRRMLHREKPDLQEVGEALADIAADGRRAGEVISSMRQLLQRGETRREEVDVGVVIDEVIDLLRSEAIGRGVRFSTEQSDRALPPLTGDPIQLKQLLLNLLMNAIDAAERASPDQPKRVDIVASLQGAEIEIAVCDFGPGIAGDPEEIFQPFVSTREGGLGMGLTISRTIAEAHDGRIWAESRSPTGAAVKLRLPL